MRLLNTAAQEAWLWLAGSFLVALLWVNLSWLFAPWAEEADTAERSESLPERIIRRVAGGRLSPFVFQVFRLLYYVGIPAAALFWGRDAVVARFLGLQPLLLPDAAVTAASTDVSANWLGWLHDLGWAAGIAVASLGLLALASLTHRRALSHIGTGREQGRVRRPSAVIAAREALYHETHWAFYRSAPIVAFGTYWGPWVGLLLVGIQASANPRWRESLRNPGEAWHVLQRAAIAVVSTVLFLQAQNLWLAFVAHSVLWWTMRAIYSAPERPSTVSPTAVSIPK